MKLLHDNEKYSIIFNESPNPRAFLKLPEFIYYDVNKAWCDFYGFKKEDALGRTPEDLNIVDHDVLAKQIEIINSEGSVNGIEFVVHTQSGGKKIVLGSIEKFIIDEEVFIMIMIMDMTEHKKVAHEIWKCDKLEKQLAQAQKMEAVGRLAGGIAHDFNNMLSLILGHADMAISNVDSSSPLREHLEVIIDAGKRSAEITRQLLGYARKQTIDPKVLNVNETVKEIFKIFGRLIGEDIELVWLPGNDVWEIKIDPSQLDQILANLCVNARDAISGTGKITVETQNVTLDETYCECHEGFIPGDYVMLAVTDNGCGIDKKFLDNIFEPFFTTKDSGKGTGLGLSTVYGIVKQNKGFINAYSQKDIGTTFKIYLPRYINETSEEEKPKGITGKPLYGRGETILVVEDEVYLLELTKRMLDNLNYKVLTATSPNKALSLVNEERGEINLLITDVIMPEMNGRQLAGHIQTINPDIKCLYMSGYTENAIARHGVLEEGIHFISKPFSAQELSFKVMEALEII